MNFLKSVFSDPDPPSNPEDVDDDENDNNDDDDVRTRHQSPSPQRSGDESPLSGDDSADASGWDFGGLMKTLASRSETVLQTYRRDLEEFGSGLKKETEVIREVAARAVRDLPTSLEAGASAAQESLETVGQAIDDFGGSVWRGTTDIITQGKEAILAMEPESNASSEPGSALGSSKRYSRFEGQVIAVQSDARTFVEEPRDGEEFGKWKLGFDLGEKEGEIEMLCYENSTLEGLVERLVPGVVDYETFWSRYYYRVYKLKQAEDARAKLVKRVIDREEEEDLSWDVDDDEDENNEVAAVVEQEKKEESKADSSREGSEVKGGMVEEKVSQQVGATEVENVENAVESVQEKIGVEEIKTEKSEARELEVEKVEVQDSKKMKSSKSDDSFVEEDKNVSKSDVNVVQVDKNVSKSDDNVVQEDKNVSKSDDNVIQEDKNVAEKLDKNDDVPKGNPSAQVEEDLEWDEINDLGELEEKKASDSNKSPPKVDLVKRLSAADDEDLSWDIEDDDEETKP